MPIEMIEEEAFNQGTRIKVIGGGVLLDMFFFLLLCAFLSSFCLSV